MRRLAGTRCRPHSPSGENCFEIIEKTSCTNFYPQSSNLLKYTRPPQPTWPMFEPYAIIIPSYMPGLIWPWSAPSEITSRISWPSIGQTGCAISAMSDDAFLAYLYFRAIKPEFSFDTTGLRMDDIEDYSMNKPWLTCEPAPAWANAGD
jgi:hypothetical protein